MKLNVSGVNTDILKAPPEKEGLISDDIYAVIEDVIDLWMCSSISYVCLIANIVALLVFVKMGFQDTMTISLTAIAFWDLVKGLSNALITLYGPIRFTSKILAHNWESYTGLAFGYINAMAGYASGALAVYVAVERCICVCLPFTVKSLLTRGVALSVNVALSVAVPASYVVIYAMFEYVWIYNPQYNVTVVEFDFSPIHHKHPEIFVYINVMSLFYPFACFTIISICTLLTIHFLIKASRIRQTTTSSRDKNPKELSARDRQVTKMLLVILSVYTVTYVPRVSFYVTLVTLPGFWPGGRYNNLMWFTSHIMHFFDIVNAAVNPFILFAMSSQFRKTLIAMFRSSNKNC